MLDDNGVIQNTADAERVGHAADALVWVLGGDPRVQGAYAAWRMAHGLHGPFPDLDTFKRALLTDRDRDRDLMQRLVRDDLRLSYAWLPDLLLYDFATTVVAEITGASLGVSLTAPRVEDLPAGRQPKGGWGQVLRDVEWFYRATIKRPPDSVRALTREYERSAARHTDARSVVQTGMKRAKKLLAALDAI
jgi:hypothetical protein